MGNRGLVSLLLLDYQAHGCCSWGPEFWCLRGRRDKATGQAAAIQFLWPRTPPKPGGLCCVVPPLKLLDFLGLWVYLPQLKIWDCRHPLFYSPHLPPLCVSVHPPSSVQTCGILQYSGVLGRVTFVELWIFYWLQMEEERKREQLKLSLF